MRKPTERLKEKVQKENLWFFILRLITKKEMYGSEIREEIQKNFGFCDIQEGISGTCSCH